jgi:hypothetical protein
MLLQSGGVSGNALSLHSRREGFGAKRPLPERRLSEPRFAKPYVGIEELAALTPWSPRTIRRKIQRRELKRGVHFFQPGGRSAKLLFDWVAIEAYIRGDDAVLVYAPPTSRRRPTPLVQLRGEQTIDVDAVEERLARLLG